MATIPDRFVSKFLFAISFFFFYKSIYSVQKQKQEHEIEGKFKQCTQHKRK